MSQRTIYADVEFRAEERDGSPVIVGRAVPWGKLSVPLWRDHRTGKPVRERFLAGAFATVLKRADLDVLALREHATSRLLARSSSGTLRLKEGPAGLDYDFDVPDTSEGRDLLVLVKRRDIRHSSFAFAAPDESITWAETDTELVRTVEEVRLLDDVSPVARPAYPDSALHARALERVQASLDAWRAGAPVDAWIQEQHEAQARLHELDL